MINMLVGSFSVPGKNRAEHDFVSMQRTYLFEDD